MRAHGPSSDAPSSTLRSMSGRSSKDQNVVNGEVVSDDRAIEISTRQLLSSGNIHKTLEGLVGISNVLKNNSDVAREPGSALLGNLASAVHINSEVMKQIKQLVNPFDPPEEDVSPGSVLFEKIVEFIRTYDPEVQEKTVDGKKYKYLPKWDRSTFKDACKVLTNICLMMPAVAQVLYENGTVEYVLERFALHENFTDTMMSQLQESSRSLEEIGEYERDEKYTEAMHDLMCAAGCVYFCMIPLMQVGQPQASEDSVRTSIDIAMKIILDSINFESSYLRWETIYMIEKFLSFYPSQTEFFGHEAILAPLIALIRDKTKVTMTQRINAVQKMRISAVPMRKKEWKSYWKRTNVSFRALTALLTLAESEANAVKIVEMGIFDIDMDEISKTDGSLEHYIDMITLFSKNPNWAPVCAEKVRPLVAVLGNLSIYTKRSLIMLMATEIAAYGKPAHDVFLATNSDYVSEFTDFISTCDLADVVPVISALIKITEIDENLEYFEVYIDQRYSLLEYFADSPDICEGLAALNKGLGID